MKFCRKHSKPTKTIWHIMLSINKKLFFVNTGIVKQSVQSCQVITGSKNNLNRINK